MDFPPVHISLQSCTLVFTFIDELCMVCLSSIYLQLPLFSGTGTVRVIISNLYTIFGLKFVSSWP